MIVKVQISQFDSEGRTMMLIYDNSRKVSFEGEATPDVLKMMDGLPKKFFEARLISDPKKKGAKLIKLEKETKMKSW